MLAAFYNVAAMLNALEYNSVSPEGNGRDGASCRNQRIARRRLELDDTTYVLMLIEELT